MSRVAAAASAAGTSELGSGGGGPPPPPPTSNVLSISGRTWLLNGQPFEMWAVRVACAAMTENLTVELINNLDAYKAIGINSITVTYAGASCLYWGSPNGPSGSPFSTDGLTIDAATQARMERIIQACDDRQMVVYVNTWYSLAGFGATNSAAARQIHKTVATKLLAWRNVVISPGGETDSTNFSDTNGIFDLSVASNIGLLGSDIHSIDPTRIYAAGGFGDPYNIAIGQNANVNALSWNPSAPASPGVNASKYATYTGSPNNINKPIFDNALDFRSASNDTAGVFTNTQKNNWYTEVNAKLGIPSAGLPGLHMCFFSEPWQQAQGQFPPAGSGTGEAGVHYELGGYGTASDPGIKWFWDYVRGYKTISPAVTTFTAASLEYLSRTESISYPLTITAWAKVTNVATDYAIAGFGVLGGSGRRQMLYAKATGTIGMQTRNDAGTSVEAATTVGPVANNWFHAAGVVSSLSSRSVYFNGHDKVTNTTPLATPASAPDHFNVGATTTPSLYLNGNIAEVAVWSIALSDAEISQLAGGALPTSIQAGSLWGYWRVTGGNPEQDVSGHNRSLSVNPASTGAIEPVDNSLTQVAMLADTTPQQRWDGFGFTMGGPYDTTSMAAAAQANHVQLFDELNAVWTGGYVAGSVYAPFAQVCKNNGITGFLAVGQCATQYTPTSFADQIAATVGSCFWTHASLQNEPDGGNAYEVYAGGYTEIVNKSQELRNRLNANGLSSVKIIANGWSHFSGSGCAPEYNALQAAGKIPNVVMAGCGHAYGDNASNVEWDNAWANYKPQGMYQTEGGYGHEQTSPARMLSNLNNGVGVYFHFGSQIPSNPTQDALDQGLVEYNGTRRPCHRSYQVINRDLSLGSLFRLVHCDDRPPNINAAYADRMIRRQTPYVPRLYGCVAKRPDGRWWLACCNGTFGTDFFNQLGGHYGAHDFQVTFKITELGSANLAWTGRRSDNAGATITNVSYSMVNGSIRMTLRWGETVALVST